MTKTLLIPAGIGREGTRQLDSLRGIASVCVMLHHYMWMRLDTQLQRPAMFGGFWVAFRVLHPVFLGHEAVLLFFTLSGFVLTLAFQAATRLNYTGYLVHRIARIYLPYLGALFVAVVGDACLHGQVPGWTSWGRRFWAAPPAVGDILSHAALIGIYVQRFNTVFWSLVVEMRVSFVMPLIYLALRMLRAEVAGGFIVVATLGDAILMPLVEEHSGTMALNLLSTIHYSLFFAIGCLLALHLHRARAIFGKWPRGCHVAFLLLCGFSLSYGWALAGQHVKVVDPDFLGAYASAGLILCSLTLSSCRNILMCPVLLWLGKISYSLYLLHMTVMLIISAVFGRSCSYLVIWLTSVCLSLLSAWLFWRVIEEPSRLLGRRIDRRLRERDQLLDVSASVESALGRGQLTSAVDPVATIQST